MSVSIFDLFSIGVGPSSSHTVGPMRAARRFLELLLEQGDLKNIKRLRAEVFGSLALTGKGHGTDKAILMGFLGEKPSLIDPDSITQKMNQIKEGGLEFLVERDQIQPIPIPRESRDPENSEKDHIHIPFNVSEDLVFNFRDLLPRHANGMNFKAWDESGELLLDAIFYSVGGGFIVREKDYDNPSLVLDQKKLPFAFKTGNELLKICENNNMSISQVMMENEKAWRSEAEVKSGILNIWRVMHDSIEKGCQTEGTLPGGLNVKRRAPGILKKLEASGRAARSLNWLNAFSIAVNEENAAGGRVVTAPTNGAAGIIPAVMEYHLRWHEQATDDDIVNYLLTSAAMGILFKENASISAAEVGCQGEVGVACSMAAAGYCELLGGTPVQVEDAAEIGMEHHLGLTCDPIKGLVQVPCIERNAMGAVQAVNAAELALMGDGSHIVSLDEVIKTMMDTGRDMQSKYKETATGGLAVKVNIPNC